MLKLWEGKEPQYRNDGTVVFGKITQEFFYDKGKQMREKNYYIPEEFQGKNLLRYEHRRKRGLERRSRKDNKRPLLVKELYSLDEIKKVLKSYKNGYYKVKKVKKRGDVEIKELDMKVNRFISSYLS